jgi:hypothetical protein
MARTHHRRRSPEHGAVEAEFPSRQPSWDDFTQFFETPPHPNDGQATRVIQEDAHHTLNAAVLHALLVTAISRLEQCNPQAAWQFVQDWAAFRIIYADFRALFEGDSLKADEFMIMIFDRLRSQKVIKNQRDARKTPTAMNALALFRYRQVLPAMQAAQTAMADLSEDDRLNAMRDRLRAVLDSMGSRGRNQVVTDELVKAALSQKPMLLAERLVELVHPVTMKTIRAHAKEYERDPLLACLKKYARPLV